ncbi:phosphatase domain-containing protein [Pyxidicoccus xibeiensis]|uniref:phosphatase domain-containing protein n=1 Tax=Pyxidicoccus xibeiensis TaxID=2906759 RepID=UPI0020A82D7A|nr:tyrosine-protein phosphatase [Pyxidicoccus xibeiensis]MCP3140243.1 tyrosine-protein phosphatase [Pyxidicoccus xibeiensis]
MKYTWVFTTFAALLGFLATRLGGPWLLLLWPAVSFGLVALAYAGAGPRLFGKQPDGRLRPWALAALLPYLLLTWATWHLARRLSREPTHAQVVPGLFVGRRLLPGELPPGTHTVLDLTSEFPEPEGIRRACHYVSLPILDASTLPVGHVAPVLRELATLPGPLYVHCAQGHGRTGMIAAALLVARGDAKDAADALAHVRRVRPGVRLSPAQWRALEELASALRAGA